MSTDNVFCNNCGLKGHIFYQCIFPITSVGVIVYRKKKDTQELLLSLFVHLRQQSYNIVFKLEFIL